MTVMIYIRFSQAAIDKENAIHKDMIQANFMDSYRNLTYKTTVRTNDGNILFQ